MILWFILSPSSTQRYTRAFSLIPARTSAGSIHRNSRVYLSTTSKLFVASRTSHKEGTSELSISEIPTILLKRSRQSKAFRNGNQLVFTRAVQNGTASLAALVRVAVLNDNENDKQQKQQQVIPIGYGVYNPNSLYRVRILCHRQLQPKLYQQITTQNSTSIQRSVPDAMRAILTHHISASLQKRKALNLPNSNTSMYRLVNGEGDGLSGLHIDVIDQHNIVIQASAAWCLVYRDIIEEAVMQIAQCENLVWKVAESRLLQDGYQDFPISKNDNDEHATPVLAKENGVIFQTFPALIGQKTGIYCDQRENRYKLSQYTQGKTVLDLCCFHGGFSLTALIQGGATYAVGVDSSIAAIEAAQENAKLNNCQDKVTFLQSDISTYMQQAAVDGIFYDVVVLDPPKLAPTASSLDKARRKYHGLNRDAIKLVNPSSGGLLMTCTCSAAMTQKDGGDYFLAMVAGAAQAAGRQVTVLSKSGAASCHTQSAVSQPSGAYLTAAFFYVHPVE